MSKVPDDETRRKAASRAFRLELLCERARHVLLDPEATEQEVTETIAMVDRLDRAECIGTRRASAELVAYMSALDTYRDTPVAPGNDADEVRGGLAWSVFLQMFPQFGSGMTVDLITRAMRAWCAESRPGRKSEGSQSGQSDAIRAVFRAAGVPIPADLTRCVREHRSRNRP
jgi:hypothetical protein